MVSDVTTIGFGVLGGIIGGIIVSVFSIIFQKNIDNNDEENKSKIEYKKIIISKLDEIIDTWEKELSKNRINQSDIQYIFGIFSSDLTSIISNPLDDLPESLKHQLQSLSISLSDIKDFSLALGPANYDQFKDGCQKITDNAKTIRKSEFLNL